MSETKIAGHWGRNDQSQRIKGESNHSDSHITIHTNMARIAVNIRFVHRVEHMSSIIKLRSKCFQRLLTFVIRCKRCVPAGESAIWSFEAKLAPPFSCMSWRNKHFVHSDSTRVYCYEHTRLDAVDKIAKTARLDLHQQPKQNTEHQRK